MVAIKDVRISNAAFKASKESSGLVAVFVGATSGIGMGSLKALARKAHEPKVYILGRSKRAAAPLLIELGTLNPQATYVFIETEVSLMRNVDMACEQIKSNEKKVDILFMSPGYLGFGGRNETIEGLDNPHALRYYTRLRFVYDLLPLLTASPLPRVISILAGGKENAIDINDLEVKNDFTFVKAASNGTTQTTLAFEELAKTYESISFIHKYPGFVDTGVLDRLMATATGLYVIPATLVRWMIIPIVNYFSTTVDEAGERGLFIATSARFPPAKPKTGYLGTPLPKGVDVAQSSMVKDGQGNGMYRLGENDDSAPDTDVLVGYRLDNVGKTVWEETQAVWDRALSRSG